MQKERETKNKKQKSPTMNPFLLQAFFIVVFVVTIFSAGIFTALTVKEFLLGQEMELPSFTLGSFLLYFIIATLFILLAVYLPRIKKARSFIFKFLFIFSALYGGLIVLSLFLADVVALVLLFGLFLWWKKSASVLSHNILIILAIAGIGAMFGLSIEAKIVILLLLVLSFYDFIAVYKTKHMVKMAKVMMEQGAIIGLIIPSQLSGFKSKTNEIKPGKFMVMGGGDLIFPLILAVSVLETGLLAAVIVSVFAFLGIIITFSIFLLQKEKKPIPALPPIALFSVIGYLVATGIISFIM